MKLFFLLMKVPEGYRAKDLQIVYCQIKEKRNIL